MSTSHNHGGARPGAGTPQRRIRLSLATARVLRELVKRYAATMPEGAWTPDNLVEQLIYRDAIEHGALDAGEPHARWVRVERGEEE